MPARPLENGRHVSGAITRMASHAFSSPKLKGASLPPASATSAAPERTHQNACPMAWFDDEQAVEIVIDGPFSPRSMQIWLAPALAIVLGMVNGLTRLRLLP